MNLSIFRHANIKLLKEFYFQNLFKDMNEPANFGTNLEKPFNYPNNLEPWSLKCPYNRFGK